MTRTKHSKTTFLVGVCTSKRNAYMGSLLLACYPWVCELRAWLVRARSAHTHSHTTPPASGGFMRFVPSGPLPAVQWALLRRNEDRHIMIPYGWGADMKLGQAFRAKLPARQGRGTTEGVILRLLSFF